MRLKNIHLANALKKLESTIRNKEELAGADDERMQGPTLYKLLHAAKMQAMGSISWSSYRLVHCHIATALHTRVQCLPALHNGMHG